jgi:hypothetical protein
MYNQFSRNLYRDLEIILQNTFCQALSRDWRLTRGSVTDFNMDVKLVRIMLRTSVSHLDSSDLGSFHFSDKHRSHFASLPYNHLDNCRMTEIG